ncbi:TetR/AcrR family transcriptional regulator [Motiliproteus coralliicola]|uniref:TetR/AcrR family transcriptional regulator n=1 Tax=Motiliproteus coralliicola TaxID=2283196 RepID=A0A369W8V3_9GAMM|nr:TetR/AcrR family transcriptional regulator [Motiliproteus coralliicola]RDE18418.1 TetR/AcrR family transcriptional regulator [Motiliproteus coralliicola]
MTTPQDNPPAKRGRPVDPELQQQRRQDLMDAAYELLRNNSYRSITIRDLATQAGTQSAMIRYYFGDKQGLFLAMLKQIADQRFSHFQRLSEAPDPIRSFIEASLQFFAEHSPLIRLITDEMLAGDSALKQAIIETGPKRMATLLPKLIESQQQAGQLRADLDPKWAAFSLVSLIMMPFIVSPVRQQAWQIDDSVLPSSSWSDHIYRLFTEGARP